MAYHKGKILVVPIQKRRFPNLTKARIMVFVLILVALIVLSLVEKGFSIDPRDMVGIQTYIILASAGSQKS